MHSRQSLQYCLKITQSILPAICFIVSLVVMLSWITYQNVFLIQLRFDYAPMQFNTALLMACMSAVTLLEVRRRWVADSLALFVFFFALATLSQYLMDTNLGIDQIFSKSSIKVLTSHPGRMAPQSAFALILLSVGYLLRRFGHKLVLFSDMMSLLALSVSLLGIAGYFSKASFAFAWGNFSKMAVLTSVLIIFLSITQLISTFLKHRTSWRLAPYVGSSVILCLGLTLWVSYFEKQASTLKAEINRTILHEGELIKGLVEDRLKAMNRMSDRISGAGPDSNWDLDLKNYFEHYPDLKTVSFRQLLTRKNQKILTEVKSEVVWDIERKNPFGTSNRELLLYYYSWVNLVSVGFEMDLSQIARRVVPSGDYITSLRIGKQNFHLEETAPPSIETEWVQEKEFQLPSISFVLRKTPSLKALASHNAGLSMILLGIIFSAAVLAAYSIHQNINLRESKDVLAVASARLQALIAAFPFGVFQTDNSGKCIYVSEKWCELTGLSPSNAHGDGWIVALHPDDRDVVFKEWDSAINSNKEFELKYRFLQKNGKIIWVQGKAVILKDSSGLPMGSIGGVLDISNEIEQQNLVEAQKLQLVHGDRMRALGQMAGGISHELNNPLAVIEMNVNLIREMAEDNVLEPKFAISTSNKISSIISRISAIIRGLQVFARDGTHDPFTATSVHDLIDETLMLCKDRFEREHVELKYEDTDRALLINCRPVQVSQVIVNLLGNALDAVKTLSNPWVKIEVTVDTDWVYLHVIDSGLGIPAPLRDKIMDPFFTTKEIGKGTGLGLSISMGIMNSHDGSIEYDTQSLNTAFVVKFPRPTIDKKVNNEKTT